MFRISDAFLQDHYETAAKSERVFEETSAFYLQNQGIDLKEFAQFVSGPAWKPDVVLTHHDGKGNVFLPLGYLMEVFCMTEEDIKEGLETGRFSPEDFTTSDRLFPLSGTTH